MKTVQVKFELREIRVVDSDTLECWCRVSFDILQRWRIRIRGVEGGELGTDQGLAGQFALQELLAREVPDLPHFVGLESVRDQFGRHVGDVMLRGNRMLSLELLKGKTHWRRDRDGTQHQRSPSHENGPLPA